MTRKQRAGLAEIRHAWNASGAYYLSGAMALRIAKKYTYHYAVIMTLLREGGFLQANIYLVESGCHWCYGLGKSQRIGYWNSCIECEGTGLSKAGRRALDGEA